MKKLLFWLILLLAFNGETAFAESKEVLDVQIKETIKTFDKEVNGGSEFLKKAKGYLVFPNVYKAGFGIGGEYGEGGLVIDGEIVGYYSTAAASLGFQLGAQKKSIIIVFLTQKALDDFRKSEGWKIGVDGSVAIAKWGVGEDINSIEFNEPVVGFVFGNKGLMYNLTLEGSKITKIKK
ncbi:lipid-binding SYLF domain-containing protein [Hydrogenimonas cancrithermarum]|uniref:Lipoprotein n=1 Tax=Hydrogenimonas cancrithermarum TaxID=2993563 RepID=A0ABM8FIP7_9BACT|nr:YSC84-related protein [Hydrogenimonas cancrithermarum]BDY12158.1 lipoprotein [Hydrogenimonas cancrithermarum]